MGQLDLIDICMAFHPKTMEFTFFSRAYGTFSSIDHTRGHKYSLDKLKKKNGIISSIFSDHNAIRLDVNYRIKTTITNANIFRLNNTLLNNKQIMDKIRKELKMCIEINENENTTAPNPWDSVKTRTEREVHSNTSNTSRNKRNIKETA